jgi:putative metalloprotease
MWVELSMKYFIITSSFCLLLLSGCGNTDVQTAADAGMDALKALTLSEKDVQEIASRSARLSDEKHTMAPPDNKYAKRIINLVGGSLQDGDLTFSYGVYISPEVNAFAMADGHA